MIELPVGRDFFPAGQSNADFITLVLNRVLGRDPLPDEVSFWESRAANRG